MDHNFPFNLTDMDVEGLTQLLEIVEFLYGVEMINDQEYIEYSLSLKEA
jgi:hypothetical protein